MQVQFLFDLDGTLTDPLEGIANCINHALLDRGHGVIDARALARFVGPPIDETFKLLTGIEDDSEIDLLVARYRERYGDVGYSENRVYPGISEALTELSEHGAHMAVCTSKRADFAERILELFGLHAFFDFVDGGDVRITKRQQIGELLLRGAITRATLMIGDRAVDIEAARGNDLQAAGVLWGYGSRAELDAAGPRFMFSTPGELPRLLHPDSWSGVEAVTGRP